MKDDYKRRRRAEEHLVSALPDADSNLIFKPIHQESLDTDGNGVRDVRVQGNEFAVASTEEWCLQAYVLDNTSSSTEVNVDSMSETSDDELIPTQCRKPLWCAIPREEGEYTETLSNFAFIAPDVIGCSASADVSTWYVRSGEQLGSVTVRGDVRFDKAICKIDDTEFAVGSMEGHLLVFTHNRGYNLKETKRVRKAHCGKILTLAYHNDLMVSTSNDWSARLWDARTKKRLAILKHCAPVVGVALSDDHIVTCSYSESDTGELRIFNNENGYALVKILHVCNWVFKPTILHGGITLFRLFRPSEHDSFHRHYLCIVDFERERVLAQLKVGCRKINDYEVLADGGIIVGGLEGCTGVVAMFPRRLRKLITRRSAEMGGGRRRMCVLT